MPFYFYFHVDIKYKIIDKMCVSCPDTGNLASALRFVDDEIDDFKNDIFGDCEWCKQFNSMVIDLLKKIRLLIMYGNKTYLINDFFKDEDEMKQVIKLARSLVEDIKNDINIIIELPSTDEGQYLGRCELIQSYYELVKHLQEWFHFEN